MLEAMKQSEAHPLCPITSSEITRSAELIKRCWPTKTSFHFKAITLEEPAKTELVPYLEAEHKGCRLPHIDRRAFVSYYIRNTVSIQKDFPFACKNIEHRTLLTNPEGQITRSHSQFDEAKSREQCEAWPKCSWSWRLGRDSYRRECCTAR